MGNVFYRLPSHLPCVGLLLFLLSGTPGSAQSGQPVVSTKISLAGVFPGTATVIPPRENLPADQAEVVSYPGDAFSAGVEGTVKLKMVIGADGSIKESRVLENGGDGRLLNASLEGFRRAGFLPGTVDGVPTQMPITVEVTFFIKREDYVSMRTKNSETPIADEEYEMDEFVPESTDATYSMSELRRLVKYPQVARENGIEGQVIVSAQIDTDGEVLKVVVRNSKQKIFEDAARDAVSKLTFTPATRNGKPIKKWVTVMIRFELEDPEPDSTVVAPAKEGAFGRVNEAKEYGMDDYVPDATQPTYEMSELHALLSYPKQARENGIEGDVTISVQVDNDGRVLQAVVREASHPIFTDVALNAAKSLTYTPGMKDGKPIKMWVTLNIVFDLGF